MEPFRYSVRALIAFGCLTLLASGCRDSHPDRLPGANEPDGAIPRFALASSLQGFSACDDLLGYLKQVANERVTAYGLQGLDGFGGFAQPMALEAGRAADATSTLKSAAPSADFAPTDNAASAMAEPGAYSTTNTVEAGIDEGDVVKTNGAHLFVLAQGRLHIVSATEPSPQLVASLSLPGTATQLVRVGTTLLITGQPETQVQNSKSSPDDRIETLPGNNDRSAIWQVDVSKPATPLLKRQLVVDGSILSIRMTGDVARVVVRTTPPSLDFLAPTGPGSVARAEQANKDVIAESKLEDWIGGFQLLDANGRTLSEGLLAECTSISKPPTFHGFTSTTLLSVNVAKTLAEPNGASVLADSGQVYASPSNLYVAIGVWPDSSAAGEDSGATIAAATGAATGRQAPLRPERADNDSTTAIHRFAFDGDRANYTATGSVQGSLMNDFSMSERDGILRVATTSGAPWGWGPESVSSVSTFKAVGNELIQLGQVGDLGRGERIYAVRFVGTNAYVVTFRQTDPLYVIDLRDPAAPAVTGELKMNGYSGYLHPIGEDRLLGVGRNADSTGRITGALVATFDVSNPSAPTRTAVYTMASAWLNTEWDHQSFLWWEPEQLALMTGTFTSGDGTMSIGGVLGLDIGPATISERGRILPKSTATSCAPPGERITSSGAGSSGASSSATKASAIAPVPGCFEYLPPLNRTVIVGNTIFALSDTMVQANALKTLAVLGQLALS